jgi:hypothetical protein
MVNTKIEKIMFNSLQGNLYGVFFEIFIWIFFCAYVTISIRTDIFSEEEFHYGIVKKRS